MKQTLQLAAAAAKGAREIAEKASNENREMTEQERSDFDAKFAEATELKQRHDRGEQWINDDGSKQPTQAQKDAAILDQVRQMTEQLGGAAPATESRGLGSKAWAKDAADRMLKAMPAVDGQKALVSGSIGVPNSIQTEVVEIGRTPTALLDLINVVPAGSDGSGGNTFSFTKQITRTNNAAVVADNATKPTSVYTLEEVEDRFRVVAHLSEAIPKRFFDDYRQTEDFLEAEMDYGLRRAIEAEVLAGDGTGEHFTGILSTSGIQTTAFNTDVFTTTRKAKTQLENLGQAPTAWVFAPADAEALDLAQDANDRFYGNGPFSSGPQTLWGIPRVTSTALTAGSALLADWRLIRLIVRQGAQLDVDAGGDLFKKNQVQLRYEGRFGLAVLRPNAVTTVDLTA